MIVVTWTILTMSVLSFWALEVEIMFHSMWRSESSRI